MAVLLALDSLRGEDRILSKDDRRELERVIKCLSPNIGEGGAVEYDDFIVKTA